MQDKASLNVIGNIKNSILVSGDGNIIGRNPLEKEPPKDKEKITIGIITALTMEYAAVKAIIENAKEYREPGQGAGRRYLLGEIPVISGGTHRLVLSLADKGTNIATNRATLLLEHFPNLESIIMVGIAGGVPNPSKFDEHVRLGDIIISDGGGIIQYDFVKNLIDRIVYRPPPRPPSAVLLEAVRLLEADEYLGKRPWLNYIDIYTHKLDAARPPEETDILASTIDPKKIIDHPSDPRRIKGYPRVFMGPIAASNTLLKNPVNRDQLRDKFGVKAIEMESSGIADATWNHELGYLSIRGICDYCDFHKNDIWQNYASIVAAAYTKALIETIPTYDGE